MLKQAKRIISISVILTMFFSCAAFADVSWSDSDLKQAENLLASGMKISAAADTTTFAGTAYASAYKATNNYTQIRTDPVGNLWDIVTNGEKITVEFDYYTETEGTNLRCELRNIASGEYTKAAQNPYWSGFSYNTSDKVTAKTWNHFKATLDAGALIKDYKDSGKSLNTTINPYFLIALEKGGSNQTYWTANFSIRGESLIIPLEKPGVTWNTARFPLDSDTTNHNGVGGTVHKLTLNDFTYTTFQALSTTNYSFVEGKYRLSFWYKEDSANTKKMTRAWRLKTGANANGDLKNTAGNTYVCLYTGNGTDVDNNTTWTYVTTDFEVNSTTNQTLLSGTPVALSWQSIGASNSSYTSDVSSCGIYISDFEIVKYPDQNSQVLSDSSLEISTKKGLNAEISLGGYIDMSVEPTFKIGETEYDVSYDASSSVADKYATAKLVANTAGLRTGGYNGTLIVTDLWGRTHDISVYLDVYDKQSKIIKFKTGSWSNENLLTVTSATVTSASASGAYTRWDESNDSNKLSRRITDLYNEGKSLYKLSFDVSGVNGSEYSTYARVQFRTAGGSEFYVDIPASELNDGQPHHYDLIIDMGRISTAKINGFWNIFWRYYGEGTVNYSNISFKYMTENSEGDEVYATLKVTNKDSEAYAFGGSFIVAEYKSGALNDVSISEFDLKGTDALAENKSRTISIPVDYDANCTYKAFWWSSLDELIPKVDSVSK